MILALSVPAPTSALNAEATKLARTSLDPELASSGTESYGGWLYHEPTPDLRDYKGHGSSGVAIGEYESMARTNLYVAAMLAAVTKPIVDAVPKIDGPDTRIVDFIEDVLFEWLEPTFAEVQRQAAHGRQVHGFQLFEKVRGRRPDKRVPGGVAVIPGRLADRLQRTIIGGWDDDDGNGPLKGVRQQAFGSVRQPAYIPADRLLLFTRERAGSNYEGESGLRPCWYPHKIQTHILKRLGIAIDREVLGIPVLRSDEIARDSEKLKQAIKDLEDLRVHEKQAWVLGKDDTLEWIHSDVQNRTNLIELYERMGNAMMLRFLLQFLGLGSTETGARSVGEVHIDMFFAAMSADAAEHASVYNGVANRPYTGLIKELVAANFGPQEEEYRLVLTVKKPENLGPLSQLIATGAINVSDAAAQDAMRDKGGLPPAPKDADGKAPAPPVKKAVPVAKPGEKPAKLADRRASHKLFAFTPARVPRAAEEHLALAEMAGTFDDGPRRFANQVGRAIEKVVKASTGRYRRLVKERDAEGLKRLALLGGTEIKAAISRYVDDMREAGSRHVRMEHDSQRVDPKKIVEERRQGEVGLSQRLGLYARRAHVKLAMGGGGDRFDDLDADELADALAGDLADDIETRAQRAATSSAAQQMTRGQWDEPAFRQAVEAAAGPAQLQRDAAVITAQAFNLGREEAAAEFGDEVEAVQRSEILDGNTCEVCAARDGATFAFNTAEHDQNLPPDPECESVASGVNRCRGILIYIFSND